jgi:GNAT superfamily N-acetyltransferase
LDATKEPQELEEDGDEDTSMIRPATRHDVSVISQLIRDLADYEKLSHNLALDEDRLSEHLFGPRQFAEVLLAEETGVAVGFALFFHNYSTFLTRPGIYLEDLFVKPAHRRRGHGQALLRAVARSAVERGCGRLEFSVLNWNEPARRWFGALAAKPMSEWTIYRLTGDDLTAVASGSYNMAE